VTTRRTAKQRGAETQRLVADYLQRNGWPYAESTGAGRSGSDITGAPGLAIEIKARRDFSPQAWLRQATTGGPGVPMVVHRPYGSGPATIAEWPVTLRLADLVSLLLDAGFGTPGVTHEP
jgi:hypothetical protein